MLVFAGAKFIYSGLFGKVPVYVSLPFIAAAVIISILASLRKMRGKSPTTVENKEQRSST